MSEAVIGMLIAFAASMLTLIIPVLVNARKNRIETNRLEAELDKIDLETIISLKKQLRELVEENKVIRQETMLSRSEMDKRVAFLEEQQRKYANGLARAIRFINKNYPGTTVPDFLLDTGELSPK